MAEFNLGNFLTGIFGGGQNNPLGMSSAIPGLATAWQQWQNADKYGTVARQAANMASPVSAETRQMYQNRINDLYTDPAKFLEGNPEFQATKKLGLGALFAKNGAAGNFGPDDGRATQDELTFLSDLGSRFVDQERKALMHMGGFQFDPANAASMLMRGNDQEIAAKNAALDALMYPFGAGQGPARPGAPGGNPGAPGGGPGNGGSGANFPSPAAIAQIAGSMGINPSQLWNLLGKMPDLFGITPDTIAGLTQSGVPGMGINPWDPGNTNPTAGLTDPGFPTGTGGESFWQSPWGNPGFITDPGYGIDPGQGDSGFGGDWDPAYGDFDWDSINWEDPFNDFWGGEGGWG